MESSRNTCRIPGIACWTRARVPSHPVVQHLHSFIPVTESGLHAFGSSRTWDHHSEYHTLEILTLRAGVAAEPARELVPDWAGLSKTLERFEEDALIFFHSGPQESEGSGLCQHFFSSSQGLTTARDRT